MKIKDALEKYGEKWSVDHSIILDVVYKKKILRTDIYDKNGTKVGLIDNQNQVTFIPNVEFMPVLNEKSIDIDSLIEIENQKLRDEYVKQRIVEENRAIMRTKTFNDKVKMVLNQKYRKYR